MKQKTLEDKKFQQKLVDKLNNGELSYQNAPIYTILLDLVQGNSVDEVYRVFCEVIKEQNKKLYSEEDMWEAYKAADSIFYDINALKLEFEKWLNNLKKNKMIKTEVYKHDGNYDLENHIKSKIRQGYKLLSCYTKDIF